MSTLKQSTGCRDMCVEEMTMPSWQGTCKQEREKSQKTITLAFEGLWRSPNTIFQLMDNSAPATLPVSAQLLLKAA